jgi:orotate phosphoribosyltransferase
LDSSFVLDDSSFVESRTKLLHLLHEKSFKRGKVVLSSGKESDFYIDCRQTSLSAAGHLLIGSLFFHIIRKQFPKAQAIGGPTLGADPLVSAVSTVSMLAGHPLNGFLVRKEPKQHGTSFGIEGMKSLSENCPVVVLEDVVTTGGSSLRAIKQIEQAGLNIQGVLVLVDRLEGGRQAIEAAGYDFYALFSRGDFI